MGIISIKAIIAVNIRRIERNVLDGIRYAKPAFCNTARVITDKTADTLEAVNDCVSNNFTLSKSSLIVADKTADAVISVVSLIDKAFCT